MCYKCWRLNNSTFWYLPYFEQSFSILGHHETYFKTVGCWTKDENIFSCQSQTKKNFTDVDVDDKEERYF